MISSKLQTVRVNWFDYNSGFLIKYMYYLLASYVHLSFGRVEANIDFIMKMEMNT